MLPALSLLQRAAIVAYTPKGCPGHSGADTSQRSMRPRAGSLLGVHFMMMRDTEQWAVRRREWSVVGCVLREGFALEP